MTYTGDKTWEKMEREAACNYWIVHLVRGSLKVTTNLMMDLFIFAPMNEWSLRHSDSKHFKNATVPSKLYAVSTAGRRVLRTGSIYSLLLAAGSSEAGALLGSEPIPLVASFFDGPLQNREEKKSPI